ncbi:MAG: 16S rRNA (cytosine(967)-C(5))-methyltransferase RsmB, partial [Clostridiales bacterium]|nr:16S rRNA (cytosine(967)-C(5))-methyltransferase RsmB [Clostridiales bacterium]
MTAREAAHSALRAFRSGRDYRAELGNLRDRREGALAMRIALGVVRNLALCDYYIASASSIKLSRIEPQALDILRAAVYQLAFLDKVPPSAAVNEAVKLARGKLNPRAAGFINAVLRKLSAGLPEIERLPDSASALALRYSHPEWLVREFIAEIGAEQTEVLLKLNNSEPPVYARVNTLKTTPERLSDELSALGIGASMSQLRGTLELRSLRDMTALEPFKRGEFFIQDPSSTMAAMSVGAFPGARVIDACAAPGGKSFAMAIEMRDEGEVLAFDTERRVPRIAEGASRLGLSIISARAGDSSVKNASLVDSADCVLADVPCSGFGVI